jgi:tetratricopeptide (TPR) repeat protein
LIRWGIFVAGGIIVFAALAAYHNSFSGPFIFDDFPTIVRNPTIRHLGSALSPPPSGCAAAGRPLVNLSLAVNYAVGGLQVWGYHAVNITVHILAGLVLFGLVRRTLRQPVLSERFGQAALPLAFAVALLWTVHPLLTEPVDCVVHRTESIVGLFYLLTLYGFIRGVTEGGRREAEGVKQEIGARSNPTSDLQPLPSTLWLSASALSCLLGMASKEVMVSAPLMVLLYDRTFVAGTFRAAWGRRWRLYLVLASTWLLLAYLMMTTHNRGQIVGFGFGVTWWEYALTQCQAIVHYLRLSFWPHPLILDYGMAVVKRPGAVALQALILSMLVVGTLVGLWRWPAMGFVGTWFFAILAPSSSVVPLTTQTVAERRMYLSLAAVIVLVVLGLYRLLGRRSWVIFLVLAVGLGCATVQRNQDYRSEVTMWSDTAAKCPDNERAFYNLGCALDKMPDRKPEAIAAYEAALRIRPTFVEAQTNLGNALLNWPGRLPEAIAAYGAALQLKPDSAEAHYNLGYALLKMPGRLPDAMAEFETALRINPDYAAAHNNLGDALRTVPGRLPDAIAQFEAALRINPGLVDAQISLGNALLNLPGRRPDAVAHFEAAVQIDPDSAMAHYDLGNAFAQSGLWPDAIAQYEAALRINPDSVAAHYNLGNTLLKMPGRLPDAIDQYKEALRLKPDLAPAREMLDRLQNPDGPKE